MRWWLKHRELAVLEYRLLFVYFVIFLIVWFDSLAIDPDEF